jgi:hypothetical protein
MRGCRVNKALSVGVVLLDLVPAGMHHLDLFDFDSRRRQRFSPLFDQINGRYGLGAIGFGLLPSTKAAGGYASDALDELQNTHLSSTRRNAAWTRNTWIVSSLWLPREAKVETEQEEDEMDDRADAADPWCFDQTCSQQRHRNAGEIEIKQNPG